MLSRLQLITSPRRAGGLRCRSRPDPGCCQTCTPCQPSRSAPRQACSTRGRPVEGTTHLSARMNRSCIASSTLLHIKGYKSPDPVWLRCKSMLAYVQKIHSGLLQIPLLRSHFVFVDRLSAAPRADMLRVREWTALALNLFLMVSTLSSVRPCPRPSSRFTKMSSGQLKKRMKKGSSPVYEQPSSTTES